MSNEKFFVKFFLLPAAAFFLLPAFAQGQHAGKKNTVKLNLTNPMIFGKKAIILGYERTIGKRQSASVEFGMVSLPSFGKKMNSDSLQIQSNEIDKGFHFAADYRFYLAKENKYEAPRGVFIGPYISYNSFSRNNDWLLNTSEFNGEVRTSLDLSLRTVGIQMGYQFVFWDRLALDFVLMGPGLTGYKFDVGLNTTLSPEDQELFFQRLNDYLAGKIPGYNLVINEGEFRKSGNFRTTSFGFRYAIHAGFRF